MHVFISFDLEAVSQFSYHIVKSARALVPCIIQSTPIYVCVNDECPLSSVAVIFTNK